MSTTTQGFTSFYAHIAEVPELGIFRRFGGYWAKRIYDDTSEVVWCLTALEVELAKWSQLDAYEKTVLGCPRRLINDIKPTVEDATKYKALCDAWKAYDDALLRHGKCRYRALSSRSKLTMCKAKPLP